MNLHSREKNLWRVNPILLISYGCLKEGFASKKKLVLSSSTTTLKGPSEQNLLEHSFTKWPLLENFQVISPCEFSEVLKLLNFWFCFWIVDDSHGQKTNPGNSDELSESFLQQFQNVLALLNTALQKLTNTKVEKIHCQTQGDSYFEEIQNETQRLIQDLQFLHERVNNPQVWKKKNLQFEEHVISDHFSKDFRIRIIDGYSWLSSVDSTRVWYFFQQEEKKATEHQTGKQSFW